MIPRAYVDEWRQYAPWMRETQVEQDLLICRLLVELFNEPTVAKSFAFRGGTALYKLFIQQPIRYSEDIDLVQISSTPIGDSLGAIRSVIDPLLGKPKWKLTYGRASLFYRFQPEDKQQLPLRLKIEINTREHFSVYGYCKKPFSVSSRWFSGDADIQTFQLEELMGTKLRALYQRKKGRDLFDLLTVLRLGTTDKKKIIHAFQNYMRFENKHITRAMFEENLTEKLESELFAEDMSILLAPNIDWSITKAVPKVIDELLCLLPGDPWMSDQPRA